MFNLLKAWFSKKPSARRQPSRTPRSFRPTLESLEARVVPSLTPVSPNAGFPYTAIVELQITFGDGTHGIGSGAMVDSFHVLTAGHVVYDHSHGGWAKAITATPEMSGNSAPFGSAQSTFERTFTGWTSWSNSHPGTVAPGDSDIGLITLNRNIGNSTGWLAYGYDNNNADFRAGTIMNTAGYPSVPGSYDGRHMEFSSGPVAGLSSDGSAIQYYQNSITTYKGQSGSPVWNYSSSTGSRVIYGVHVAGDESANSLNFATRITQSIYNALQSWRQSDTAPKSAVTQVGAASFGPSLTQASLGSLLVQAQDAGGDGGVVSSDGSSVMTPGLAGDVPGPVNGPTQLIDLLFMPATALQWSGVIGQGGSAATHEAEAHSAALAEHALAQSGDASHRGRDGEAATSSERDTARLDAMFKHHLLGARPLESDPTSDE